jgi:hypothetical protein
MAEGTNTAGTKEQFGRKYTDYNPAPTQGPTTEILGLVLTPTPAPTPSPSPSP